MSEKLMSIQEAATAGIQFLRLPKWVNPLEYLKIDIVNGKHRPWFHLYAPMNIHVNKCDPVNILYLAVDSQDQVWIEHTGPLHTSSEYVAEVQRWA